MKTLLNTAKKIIESNYKIDSGIEDISQFLIDDKKYDMIKDSLQLEARKDIEACVVVDTEGYAALYFSDDFRKRFESNNPMKNGLSNSNVDMFTTVIEEADHLLNIGYCNENDKPFSLFELELQADITKYLMLRLAIAQQEKTFPRIRDGMKHFVKEHVFGATYKEKDPEIQARYINAAKLGRAFTNYLETIDCTYSRIIKLREFYRLPHEGKIEAVREKTGVSLL
jgi:hypothetical protein